MLPPPHPIEVIDVLGFLYGKPTICLPARHALSHARAMGRLPEPIPAPGASRAGRSRRLRPAGGPRAAGQVRAQNAPAASLGRFPFLMQSQRVTNRRMRQGRLWPGAARLRPRPPQLGPLGTRAGAPLCPTVEAWACDAAGAAAKDRGHGSKTTFLIITLTPHHQ